MDKKRAGGALQGGDEQARKAAASLMGSAWTERKKASALANIANARKPFKPLEQIECNCGAGDSLEHRSTCPRGRTIRRRRKLGQPLQ
jgi:hypothetical protein